MPETAKEARMKELLEIAVRHLSDIESWFSRSVPPSYSAAGAARSLFSRKFSPKVKKMDEKQALEFKDLTDEVFRVYEYPNNVSVRIDAPQSLNVKAPPAGTVGGGSHRVVDMKGISHYLPAGWIHLFWKVKEGKPYFAF